MHTYSPAPGQDPQDTAAVHALLTRYQQAHRDGDWDAARACHADFYFKWRGHASNDPLTWSPQCLETPDTMALWGQAGSHAEARYTNDVEFLRTEIQRDLALAVVRETGSWQSDDGQLLGAWENDVNVWYAAKLAGEWKIVAVFYRTLGKPA